MADLDRLLRSDVAAIAAEQAHPPDFDTIEHRGLRRRRRRAALVAAGLAAAAVVAVVAGGQLLPGRQDASPTYPVDRPTGRWTAIRSPGQVVEERAGRWLDPVDAADGAMDIRRVEVGEIAETRTSTTSPSSLLRPTRATGASPPSAGSSSTAS